MAVRTSRHVKETSHETKERLHRPSIAPDTITEAARATLLILRASLPEEVSTVPNLVWLGSEESLDDDTAAARLAALGRVECRAAPVRRGIGVVCEPLQPAVARHVAALRSGTGGYIHSAVLDSLVRERSSVLIRGRGEAMLVSAETLESAYSRFVVGADGFTFGDRAPTEEERRDGAAWVVEFGHAAPW